MIDNELMCVLSQKTGISQKQVSQTVTLLENGATIPFISRYRKEVTGGLDELALQRIQETYSSLKELSSRKEYILGVIAESGKLTDELKDKINGCWDSIELEDLYLPYKPRRRTRAESARLSGLEPLAKIIMSQHGDDIEYRARKFVNDNVKTVDDAILGAKDIIAEWVSESANARNRVRSIYARTASLVCKVVKGKELQGEKFSNYFNTEELLKRCASHRLLAMLRGEAEGVLKLNLKADDSEVLEKLYKMFVKGSGMSSRMVSSAIEDSYKRLIKPSIETEMMNAAKQEADRVAIDTFAQNLRQLLFAPPLGKRRVLAIDPGFRTGCKIVCLDEQGALLYDGVIYPTPPKCDVEGAGRTIENLVNKYKIDAIAVGNGTASRETEQFLSKLSCLKGIEICVVNESGASIYSASKIAREEFPDKDVTVRGAVSIGRRLLDPLAELVKIDPKSIGVGQYQHDVDQTKLKESLTFTVESCVNSVGVNVNTASKELLSYVSGLGAQLAHNIVAFRTENGPFNSRRDLLNVPRFGNKAFQQSSAFLRIPGSANPLDNSAVHPERYSLVERMASDCGCEVAELIKDENKRKNIDLKRYLSDDVGEPTLNDIIQELEKPGRDPRNVFDRIKFDETIKTIDQLKPGMILNGIVTNVTQFGAFVDIGVHENGLVHVSELSDRFILSPSDVVKLSQIVKVKVKDVDVVKKRISLTMKGLKNE